MSWYGKSGTFGMGGGREIATFLAKAFRESTADLVQLILKPERQLGSSSMDASGEIYTVVALPSGLNVPSTCKMGSWWWGSQTVTGCAVGVRWIKRAVGFRFRPCKVRSGDWVGINALSVLKSGIWIQVLLLTLFIFIIITGAKTVSIRCLKPALQNQSEYVRLKMTHDFLDPLKKKTKWNQSQNCTFMSSLLSSSGHSIEHANVEFERLTLVSQQIAEKVPASPKRHTRRDCFSSNCWSQFLSVPEVRREVRETLTVCAFVNQMWEVKRSEG